MNVFKIDWRTVKIEKVEYETWNDKVRELRKNGMTRLANKDTRYSDIAYLAQGYFIVQRSNNWYLYFLELDGPRIFSIYPNTEEDNPYTGYDAMMALTEKFKEITGRSFYSEFTTYKENLDLRKELKQCVPAPVNWAHDSFDGTTFYADMFFKNDISSAYPAMASKSLPKLKDFKKVDGRVAPTKEYPFAYYLNSHTMAIYDEFDSLSWKDSEFYMTGCNQSFIQTINYKYNPQYYIKPQDETTLLLKQSEYSLKDVMEYFYSNRKNKPEYKFFMNAFLGFLHKESDPEFPHIAAVVLGRCVNFILNTAEYLRDNDQLICLIATDSIGWSGNAVPEITDTEKKLGAFISEYKDAEFMCKGPKCYQIKTDDDVKTVWAGVSKNKTKDLKFGDIAKCNFTRNVLKLNEDGTIRKEAKNV